jgi:hypothetical protein
MGNSSQILTARRRSLLELLVSGVTPRLTGRMHRSQIEWAMKLGLVDKLACIPVKVTISEKGMAFVRERCPYILKRRE